MTNLHLIYILLIAVVTLYHVCNAAQHVPDVDGYMDADDRMVDHVTRDLERRNGLERILTNNLRIGRQLEKLATLAGDNSLKLGRDLATAAGEGNLYDDVNSVILRNGGNPGDESLLLSGGRGRSSYYRDGGDVYRGGEGEELREDMNNPVLSLGRLPESTKRAGLSKRQRITVPQLAQILNSMKTRDVHDDKVKLQSLRFGRR